MNTIENNINKLKGLFSKSKSNAAVLIKDKRKTSRKMEEAFKKATANKGNLQNIWFQLQLLLSLVKDYTNGNYHLPKKSIISIVAAILYFLSPVDLIPDFILGFGLIDDVFIISMVLKQVANDLEKYQVWKTLNG